MQPVKLMVPVCLLVEIIIVGADQQLAVSFDYGLDDFEEGEVLSLLLAEVLPVELYELEEDALDEGFCMLAAALLI